ncbi:hypothetical protein NEOLI_005340 [Neolecta irregularis DAH-3]|uniref:Uncharacterized protein n=1 Tax=Neolecta irregularis (strain DAH-3) TaxID=1198029 RepID=A0A1U7LP06_NEOID|nr:hypothetical protein NEOLI_005340 [Neolecta irregularis DAH-3]|eukprot:OLL24369.1 hypothetical protein NEOLI_005340 [Neolecta irregularis DAH-3]
MIFGYTLGFVYFVIWNTFRQYRRSNRMSVYIWMCTGEIISSLAAATFSWLRLLRGIPLNLGLLIATAIIWTIQTQLLFLIMINRLNLLLSFTNPSRYQQIKYSTLIVCGIINLLTFGLWAPTYYRLVPQLVYEVWQRLFKVLIGLLDAALNIYFIRTVNQELVDYGLSQYIPLAKFNFRIMILSLSFDVIVVALTWLPNQFTYSMCRQFVFLAKLNIELSMSDFIVKIMKNGRQRMDYTSNSRRHAITDSRDDDGISVLMGRAPDSDVVSFGTS